MSFLKSLFKNSEPENIQNHSDEEFVAVVSGKKIATKNIEDDVFSQEMIGQTLAIAPNDGIIVSPVNGVLEVMYPTAHAFAVRANDGRGVLVHIGINTVEMNGKGFEKYHNQGDIVKAGEPIVKVNFKEVEKRGYDPTVMTIITEGSKVSYKDFDEIKRGEVINL